MRRPLVIIFLCFFTGCILTWYGEELWRKGFLFLLILCSALLIFMKPWKEETVLPVSMALTALLAGMFCMGMELNRPEPLLAHCGEEVTVTGIVVKEKEYDYGKSLLIRPDTRTRSIWERLSRRKIWISLDCSNPSDDISDDMSNEPWVGWCVQLTGIVKEPGFPRNPGSFDQRSYLRTLGAQVVIDVKEQDVTVLEASTRLSAQFRALLERRWIPVMGEKNCGGLMGLLFGTSDEMEEDTLDAFQKIGLGHLLAVSGLHVGLVYGAVQKAFGERGRTVFAQILCCAAAICYAGLAGFTASASRAALMIVIHSIGRMLFRPYDMATSASVAGMLILTHQPCQCVSSGFQLSMLAAFGIACVLPRLSYAAEQWADRKRSTALRWIADHIVPVLVIQLVMSPICARRFQCISLWSLGLNPLCIAAAGVLIPLALGLAGVTVALEVVGTSGLGWILEPMFTGLTWLTGSIMAGMLSLGEWAAKLPGTMTTAGFPPGWMLLYYFGLFTWSSETFYLLLRKRSKALVIIWISAGMGCAHLFPWWIGVSTSPLLWTCQEYPVVFVDVGQGDCIHIQTPQGKNILIDGGGSSRKNVGKDTLLPYLLYRGVTSIDLALATHLHQDHFQGLKELAQEMPIHQLGLYEANRYRQEAILNDWGGGEAFDRNVTKPQVIYLNGGNRITLEPEIWIDVLAPPNRSEKEYRALAEDDSDENDSCLIFLVHYKGLELLITGDLGQEGEHELLEKGIDLKTHILKIGHHGSKYSTSEEFLQAKGAEIAVISVGVNYFGHPSERVIELLEKNSIIIGRTDQQGAVIVKKIRQDYADIISGNGELTWRIDLRENK